MNFNQVILVGRLTNDPALKDCKDGGKRASFTLAVNRNQKNGNEKEADFLNIVAWNNLAEISEQYLKKGRLILIDGAIRRRNYEKDEKKYNIVEIVAQRIKFLEKKAA